MKSKLVKDVRRLLLIELLKEKIFEEEEIILEAN